MNDETRNLEENKLEVEIPSFLNNGENKKISERQRRIMKRNRIRKRWYRIQTIASIVIIAILAIVIIGFVQTEKKYAQNEYKLNVEQVNKYKALLDEQTGLIEEIQQNEWEVADDFYRAVKKVCKKSDDEVIQRLWKEKFPNDESFTDDRAGGIVTIYALLDNHVEIRCDDNVLNNLQTVDMIKLELRNAVDTYNLYYEYYSFWVDEWNSSSYTVMKEGKLKNEYKPKQITLTLNVMDQELIDDLLDMETGDTSDESELPVAGAIQVMVPKLDELDLD